MRETGALTGLVWFYLMSNEHSNATGFYRIPTAYIVEDMGQDIADVERALRELTDAGGIIWDKATKTVLVRDYLDHNPFDKHGQVTHQVVLWEDGKIPRRPESSLREFLPIWWPKLKATAAALRESGERATAKDPKKGILNIQAAERVSAIQQEVEGLLSRFNPDPIEMES